MNLPLCSSALPAIVVVLATLAAGCSGSADSVGTTPAGDSPEGAPLFEAPSGDATADRIEGVWGGVLASTSSSWSFDARMRIAATSITFATRCQREDGANGAIVAVTSRARVTSTSLEILESKNDARTLDGVTCRAGSHPGKIGRCAPTALSKTDCFEMSGTSLVLHGATPLEELSLTKLSD